MSVAATCSGCGETFEARHRNARWCSDRCRKAASRRAEVRAERPSEPQKGAPSGLVAAVTAELDRARVAHTFAGQLAVSLAKRLSDPDETGASSLSKELRTVMAAALEGVTPPSAKDEDDDEVAKARAARERKASQAARRA